MCFGLKGFVLSAFASWLEAFAVAPKLARTRSTTYEQSATTTTRRTVSHTFLKSRNTRHLLPLPSTAERRATPIELRAHVLIKADVLDRNSRRNLSSIS